MENIYRKASASSLRINTCVNTDSREAESAILRMPITLKRNAVPTLFSPEIAIDRSAQIQTLLSSQPNIGVMNGISQPNICVHGKLRDNLSKEELIKLTRGIIRLRSTTIKDRRENVYHGMAFLAEIEGKKFIYSAKHNFVDPELKKSVDATKVSFPGGNKDGLLLKDFTNAKAPTPDNFKALDIANYKTQKVNKTSVQWKYGYDVIKFQVLDNAVKFVDCTVGGEGFYYSIPDIGNPIVYADGMRVAIAVWGIPHPTTEEWGGSLGCSEDITLYAGEIETATKNTIEVSYNSFHGCSGAPVICIDKRDEFQDLFGKVIAVHGGHPTKFFDLGINRNIAFKIVGTTATKGIFTGQE